MGVEYNMPPFTLDETRTLVKQRLVGTSLSLPDADIVQAWQASQGHPGRLLQSLRENFHRMMHT